MPKQDPYLKYPEFVELRDQLLNTTYGNDLYSILTRKKLPDGYKLKDSGSIGKFYIDAGSRSYMRKLPDGRWYYAVLTDGKVFHEDWFIEIEEMLRSVWVKILVKRTPTGIKRVDFEEWLKKDDCLGRGKGFDIEDVISSYLSTFNSSFRISNRIPIFDSTVMQDVFNFLGIEKYIHTDGILRPILCIGQFFIGTDESRSIWDDILGKEKIIMTLNDNPLFRIRSSHKKGTKEVGILRWGFNKKVVVTIHAETKEEMEKEILSVMRSHIKDGFLDKITDDEELIKFIETVLTPEEILDKGMIKSMASYVNKNPKLILKIPERLRISVKEELGMTDENEILIRDAVDYGIL
jgi:hypothetical protein